MGFRANYWQSSLGVEFLKGLFSWTSCHGLCCWPCGAWLGKTVGPAPRAKAAGVFGSCHPNFSRQIPCAALVSLPMQGTSSLLLQVLMSCTSHLSFWDGLRDIFQRRGQPYPGTVVSVMEGQPCGASMTTCCFAKQGGGGSSWSCAMLPGPAPHAQGSEGSPVCNFLPCFLLDKGSVCQQVLGCPAAPASPLPLCFYGSALSRCHFWRLLPACSVTFPTARAVLWPLAILNN